jgi:hypothetical protein
MVDVYCSSTRLWSGVFAFGETGFDFLSIIPGSTHIVVSSHGQGYVVDAERPDIWKIIPSAFLNGGVIAPEASCVAVHDDWTVYSICGSGNIAEHQLNADGIQGVRASGNVLSGTYEDASAGGAQRPFRIELGRSQPPSSQPSESD